MTSRAVVVLVALFLDMTAFGMVFPDVQLHARALGAPGWLIGALLASMFLVQLIASPRWGSLSDRIGRKPVALVCTTISALSWVAYALSTNLGWILLSRVLAGLGAANVVTVQAHLADTTPEEGRAAAMGKIGAAMSGGLILGPALGMRIAALGGTPLLGGIAAACSGAAVLLLAVSMPKAQPVMHAERKSSSGFNFRLLREIPGLPRLAVLATVSWFALAALEGTFGRLVTEHFMWPATVFGDIFSFESLLGVLVQGVLLAWLAKRFAQGWLLRVGYLLTGAGLLLTPYAPSLVALFAFSAIYSLGSGVANPTVNSACSAITPADQQGELFGLLQGARSVGFLVGPALGGALFDWEPVAPYLVAGGAGLLAALLVPSVRAPEPQKVAPEAVP